MQVMNASDMRDARKNRWLHAFGGGIGFEFWQIAIGAVVGLITGALVSVVFGQMVVGIAVGLGLGWAAAIAPNYINTHHQESRDYLQGQVRMRIQKTLVVNDKRVSEPPDWRERFHVVIAEFPASENGDDRAPGNRTATGR
jgi:hypothetical protein